MANNQSMGYDYYGDYPEYFRLMIELKVEKGNRQKLEGVLSDLISKEYFKHDKSYEPVNIPRKDDLKHDYYLIRGHVRRERVKDIESLPYVYHIWSDSRIRND